MRFATIMMVLLAAVLITPAAAAQSLRDETVAAVHAAVPDAVITIVDPLSIKVKRPSGHEIQINLDRITSFCDANSADDCAAEKQHFLAGIVEGLTIDDTVAPTQLRLLVRGNDYIAAYVRETASLGKDAEPPDPPVTMNFAEGVSLILAADFPTTTRMVNASTLKTLGLNRDQAFALGTRQVLASLPKIPTAEELDGKLMSFPDLDYGASMLLEPDRWRSLAVATGGRLFVAIPADNDVLIGTVESDEDLRKLEKLVADSYAAAGRGISPFVYRWSPSGWEVAR